MSCRTRICRCQMPENGCLTSSHNQFLFLFLVYLDSNEGVYKGCKFVPLPIFLLAIAARTSNCQWFLHQTIVIMDSINHLPSSTLFTFKPLLLSLLSINHHSLYGGNLPTPSQILPVTRGKGAGRDMHCNISYSASLLHGVKWYAANIFTRQRELLRVRDLRICI